MTHPSFFTGSRVNRERNLSLWLCCWDCLCGVPTLSPWLQHRIDEWTPNFQAPYQHVSSAISHFCCQELFVSKIFPVRVCSISGLSDRFVSLWRTFPPSIPSTFKFFIPKLARVSLQQASWSTSLWFCYFHYAALYLVSAPGLCLWCLSAGVFGNVCTDNRGERHSSC